MQIMNTTAVIFEPYNCVLWGMLLILVTVMAQGFIAAIAHRKQKHYIPGILNEKLGHESFVFRSYRTFQNSLENISLMMGSIVLAIFTGVNPSHLSICVWIIVVARLIHMALYYKIATEKNPSPRSYFFMIGYFTNIAIFVLIAMALLN